MLLIALTSVAACIVWLTVLLRAVGIFGCGLIMLAVASCFGYDFFNVKLGPLPLTADRALTGVLIVVYALQRLLRAVPPKKLDLGDVLFALFLLTMTLSTLLHDWRWRDSQPLASLLFMYLAPASLYWLMRGSVFDDRQLRWLFGGLAVFGVYLGLIAICELTQQYALIFPRFIVTTNFTQWLGRARGPFLNPTTNGIYLSTALFALLMWWPHAGRIGRAAVATAAIIIAIGIFATLTRSCWIGATAGLGLIVLAVLPRGAKVPATCLAGILAALFVTFGGEAWVSFKRDKDVSQYHMEQSAKLRPILAAVAWRVFQDYPVFGCGYGQYKRVDIDYRRDPNSELPLEQAKHYVQHNLFLGILVDTGLVGLTLYLGTLGFWGWRAWQLWRSPQATLVERQVGLLTCALLTQWCLNGMFHDVALAAHANLVVFVITGVSQGVQALVRRPATPRLGRPLFPMQFRPAVAR